MLPDLGTLDPTYRLIAIGSIFAALSSLVVQTLVRPYVGAIAERYRSHVLRFAPVVVCTVLTAVGLPVVWLGYGIELSFGAYVRTTILYGIGGGAGAKLAFDFWRLRDLIRGSKWNG